LWWCADSQEVGLEAAILERVRNSSLVEWHRADNVTGLKRPPEAADPSRRFPSGEQASERVVGERSGVAEKPERQALVERTEVRMPE
jgi:hypothetical protein